MNQKHKQMIDWKYMRTYDILVAEYQFVGFENSVRNKTYCKDIELFFIHILAGWFFDLHSKSVNQSHLQ